MTPVRVLLLEDNPGDARLVQVALAREAPGEFAVTRVERLAEALAGFGAETFDAALCDLGLPDSEGLATVRAIVAHAPALPLVVLTGSHSESLGRESIRIGAQDYVVKDDAPAASVARALRYAIERKRLETELRTANETLERRVAERTAEIDAANLFLRASVERYQAVARTAADAIVTADGAGAIAGWSAGAERIFGYAEGEVLGQSLTRFMPERFRDAHRAGMRRVLAGGDRHFIGKTVELVGLGKSGNEFPVELSLAQWRSSEGSFFTGFIRDISERKRVESSLRDSENRFRGLVEQSLTGVYISRDGVFRYANPRLEQVLGFGPGELVGVRVDDMIVAEDLPVVEAQRRRLREGATSVAFEVSVRRPDGAVVRLGVQGRNYEFEGEPVTIGMAQDITEKKRVEEKIEQYVRELQSAFMGTVEVATKLSEMRDPYTAGHEQRVARISVAIGAVLGLDESRLKGLEVAGALHDVGKINIPAEILSKPSRLNAIEFQLIRTHPQAGFDVLRGVKFSWPVAQVALQHHERMDGSGYPQGLEGEAILFEARIVAVADVVEAMSSHRPYRSGLGIEAALAEIERGRASSYDPDVADACLKLFREDGYAIPALV